MSRQNPHTKYERCRAIEHPLILKHQLFSKAIITEVNVTNKASVLIHTRGYELLEGESIGICAIYDAYMS